VCVCVCVLVWGEKNQTDRRQTHLQDIKKGRKRTEKRKAAHLGGVSGIGRGLDDDVIDTRVLNHLHQAYIIYIMDILYVYYIYKQTQFYTSTVCVCMYKYMQIYVYVCIYTYIHT
jgi:hypothetical protein